MIQAKRVGVCAGMLLVSAVAVLFLRYPARIEDEEPVPFKIIGLGEKGLQSWTSPPFGPGIDCHHEMHNDDSSCEILDGCFKRHGIELVMNDSGQTLPFWYSAPTGHKWTQVAMQAAARVSTSDATRLMAFLFDHFHKSYENFFDWTPSGTLSGGVVHGAIWILAGTQPAFGYNGKDGIANPWPTIEKLCPMPKQSTKIRSGEQGTLDSLFDLVTASCLHGIGHAGFYSAFYQQNDGHFDACRDGGKLTRVLTPTVMQAFKTCESAPSIALRFWCFAGFYHGVAEHHDHIASNESWMWPCDAPFAPFPEMCYKMMFTVMGQAWSFNLPYGDELVNTLGGEWALWQQRWNEMEKAINSGGGPYGVCTSTNAPEDSVLACIDGLAALGSGYCPPCAYVTHRVFNNSARYDLIEMCTALVAPPNTKFVESTWNSTMERRWFACVGGISHMEAKEIQCERLLTVQSQPDSLRVRAFNLCQLTSKDSYITAHAGTPASKRRTIQWDWEWWKKSDVRNLYPSNNWTGAGPGYSFLEPYSTSPLSSKPYRFSDKEMAQKHL